MHAVESHGLEAEVAHALLALHVLLHHHDALHAARAQRHRGHDADRPGADHGAGVGGLHAADVQPVEGHGQRLDEGAVLQLHALGQPPEALRVHHDGLGVRTRDLAEPDAAGHRDLEVVVVERLEREDADALPFAPALHVLADGVDHAGELVAEHRAGLNSLGGPHVEVGAADAAGLHPHAHLTGARGGLLHVTGLQHPLVVQDDGPHAAAASCSFFTDAKIARARSSCSRSCVAITLQRSSALAPRHGGVEGHVRVDARVVQGLPEQHGLPVVPDHDGDDGRDDLAAPRATWWA